MAVLTEDYLDRVRNRRFDAETRSYGLSDSFANAALSKGTRYIYESMRPIEDRYRQITLRAIENVKNHLSREWSTVGRSIDVRQQGSVTSLTEIEATSDADIVVLHNKYHYCNGHEPANPYIGNVPQTMSDWKKEIYRYFSNQYNSVEEKSKCVLIDMQNPKRKIDVVPAAWYLNKNSSKDSSAGVVTYENGKKHNTSFPFKVTDHINEWGRYKEDSNRKAIRYLKSLKADSDGEIELTSFEIYSFITDVVSEIPTGINGPVLSLFLSNQIGSYLRYSKDSERIASPCGSEKPFENRRNYFERNFTKLQQAMEQLHASTRADMYSHPRIFEQGIIYS